MAPVKFIIDTEGNTGSAVKLMTEVISKEITFDGSTFDDGTFSFEITTTNVLSNFAANLDDNIVIDIQPSASLFDMTIIDDGIFDISTNNTLVYTVNESDVDNIRFKNSPPLIIHSIDRNHSKDIVTYYTLLTDVIIDRDGPEIVSFRFFSITSGKDIPE